VNTKLQGIPIATYVRVIQNPKTDPDIWIGSWTMDYADDSQLYWSYYYSKNIPPVGGDVMFYKDPVTDKLLFRAMRATSSAQALRLFTQVCHRVYKAAPNIWPVQPNERIALRSNIHGYEYNYQYGENYYPLYNMYKD
jgi:ABC-type transport system substrate-binding protein